MLKNLIEKSLPVIFSLLLLSCGGGTSSTEETLIGSEETTVAVGTDGSLLFPPDSIPAGSKVTVSEVESPPLSAGLEPVGQAYKVDVEHPPEEPVQVSLVVPPGESVDDLIVLRVEDNGTIWLLQSELVDGHLVAETPGFSTVLIARLVDELKGYKLEISGPDKLPVGVVGQYQEQALAGVASVERIWTLSLNLVEGELDQRVNEQGYSQARFKGLKAGVAKLYVTYSVPGTPLYAFARKKIEVVESLDSFNDGFSLTVYGPDLLTFDPVTNAVQPVDLTARILNTDVDEVSSWQCMVRQAYFPAYSCGECSEACSKIFTVKNLTLTDLYDATVTFTAHGRYGSFETYGEKSLDIKVVADRPVITSVNGNEANGLWTLLTSVFDFNVEATINGGTPPYNYIWELLPTSKEAYHTHTELKDNFAFSLRFPGTYQLHLKVKDSNGESSEGVYPVSIMPRKDFQDIYTHLSNVPEKAVDIGETVTLNVAVNGSVIVIGGEKVDYVVALDWGDGSEVEVVRIAADNSVDGASTSFSHAYDEPGEYAVKVAARARWLESADTAVPYHILNDDKDVSRSNATITAEYARPVVEVSSSDDQGAEYGPDTMLFTFTRNGNLDNPLAVLFQLSGTATPDQDYNTSLQTTTITIPAGEATADLVITPVADGVDNEGEETVVVSLMPDSAYTSGSADSAAAIIADYAEPLPRVSITASDSSASEKGQLSGMFTITRDGDLSGALTVTLSLSGSASYYSDYTFSTSRYTATFPAGVNSLDIEVIPKDDAVVEGEETVELSILQSTVYEFGSSAFATVFIADRGAAAYVFDRVEISKYVASNDLCGDTMSCIHIIANSSFKTNDRNWTLSEGSGSSTFKETYDLNGDVLTDYQVDFSFDVPPQRIVAGETINLASSATASGYTQDWSLPRSFTYYYAYTVNNYRTSGGWQWDGQVRLVNSDMPYDETTGRFSGNLSASNTTSIDLPSGLYDQIEIGGRLGWDPGINIVWFYRLED